MVVLAAAASGGWLMSCRLYCRPAGLPRVQTTVSSSAAVVWRKACAQIGRVVVRKTHDSYGPVLYFWTFESALSVWGACALYDFNGRAEFLLLLLLVAGGGACHADLQVAVQKLMLF